GLARLHAEEDVAGMDLALGRVGLLDLDQGVAERRLHHARDLADRHLERGELERRVERTALEPAEVAARLRGARILRERLRQARERLALLDARERIVGALLHGRLLERV